MSVWTGCPSRGLREQDLLCPGLPQVRRDGRGEKSHCVPSHASSSPGVEVGNPERRVCRLFAPLSTVQPTCSGLEGCRRVSGSVDADADRNWLKSYVYRENRTKKPILGFLARPLRESAKLCWHQPYQTSAGTGFRAGLHSPSSLPSEASPQAPWGLNRQVSLHPSGVRRP